MYSDDELAKLEEELKQREREVKRKELELKMREIELREKKIEKKQAELDAELGITNTTQPVQPIQKPVQPIQQPVQPVQQPVQPVKPVKQTKPTETTVEKTKKPIGRPWKIVSTISENQLPDDFMPKPINTVADVSKSKKKAVDKQVLADDELIMGVNDVATKFPNIVNAWDIRGNHGIRPQSIIFNTTDMFHFTCPICNCTDYRTPKDWAEKGCAMCRKTTSKANPAVTAIAKSLGVNVPAQKPVGRPSNATKTSTSAVQAPATKKQTTALNAAKTVNATNNLKSPVLGKGKSEEKRAYTRKSLYDVSPNYVLDYWDWTANGSLEPDNPKDVPFSSDTLFWFFHPACKHSWQEMPINIKGDKKRCPFCSDTKAAKNWQKAVNVQDNISSSKLELDMSDIRKLDQREAITRDAVFDKLEKDWDPELNHCSFDVACTKQDALYFWSCSTCNYHYAASITQRLQERGKSCPNCEMIMGAKIVDTYLKKKKVVYSYRASIGAKELHGLRFEFYLPAPELLNKQGKLEGSEISKPKTVIDTYTSVIEVDNGIRYLEEKNDKRCLDKIIADDNTKIACCLRRNIHMLRIPLLMIEDPIENSIEKYVEKFLTTHIVDDDIIKYYDEMNVTDYSRMAREQNARVRNMWKDIK